MSLTVPNRSRERMQMCMASHVLHSIIPMSSWLCSYVNEHVITWLRLRVSSPCLFRVNIRIDEEPHLVTLPLIFDLWRNVAYNQATCLPLGELPSMLKGIKFYILHPSHARSLLWTPFLMRTLLCGHPTSCESTDTTALPLPVPPSPLPFQASPWCPFYMFLLCCFWFYSHLLCRYR